MSKILEFLQGKKTYITATLFAVFNFGVAIGWWAPDNQIILLVNSLLAALGFGFLRAGVNKSSGT
jgi:hypothetical protein